MTQALYAHMNNKIKKKKLGSGARFQVLMLVVCVQKQGTKDVN
jgi:hypothetical protein